MAVDILETVKRRIRPLLTITPDFVNEIPGEIADQIALQGWTLEDMNDKQRLYVAASALEALLPNIVLTYADELEKRIVGPETVEMPSRAEFMKLLKEAIEALKTSAAREAAPEDVAEPSTAWTGAGVRSF